MVLAAMAELPLHDGVMVLQQASILGVASTLDPLRSANRHLGREAFRWRVVSPGGAAVPLSCGLELPSTGALPAAEGAAGSPEDAKTGTTGSQARSRGR